MPRLLLNILLSFLIATQPILASIPPHQNAPTDWPAEGTQAIAGVVSGDLDFGKMLETAAFQGFTAGLTAGINADDFGIEFTGAATNPLLGFGKKLTIGNMVEGAIDAAISSAMSSAVYGTDFESGFLKSFGASVANLAMADFQTLIGDQKLMEGSIEHMALHGVVGCAFAEISGGDCAAGAVAAVAQSVYAGTLQGTKLSDQDIQNTAALIGGLAGFLASSGKAANVSLGGSIARSGIANNYLTHNETVDRALAREELADCEADPQNCTADEMAALRGAITLLDALDLARDQAYIYACTQQGALQCLAARHEYKLAEATYMDENRRLGDAGYVGAYGAPGSPLFEAVQDEFNSGLAVDRLAMQAAVRKGMDFTQRNLNALGLGAGSGALVATSIFGARSLAQCYANPICRLEVGTAIAEAAAGDALGTATLVPVVGVIAGKTVVKYGDEVVGLVDDVTGVFTRVGRLPDGVLKRVELIDNLAASGTRITPGNVVDIRQIDGKTVWLETGSDSAGLQHIYKRHEVDFANKGIPRGEVPNVIMNALERGNVVGTNGSANVYRVTHNGIEHNIAIGVGSNGFVVRANPVSSWKPLP